MLYEEKAAVEIVKTHTRDDQEIRLEPSCMQCNDGKAKKRDCHLLDKR